MKKKSPTPPSLEHRSSDSNAQELEILKAVAQAWHNRSGSSRPTNEYDAHRQNFQSKPSRFKLEDMKRKSLIAAGAGAGVGASWDFRQSLLDSYEIVTVARRLERGLLSDDPFSGLDDQSRVRRRRKVESKNSLRNLFNRVSSKRFNEADVPRKDDTQF